MARKRYHSFRSYDLFFSLATGHGRIEGSELVTFDEVDSVDVSMLHVNSDASSDSEDDDSDITFKQDD